MGFSRKIAGAVLLAACAGTLQGCDTQSLRGTKGLPPAPENVAYPSVGSAPADSHGRLKSVAEQKQLEAELLAHKRPRR